MHCDRSLPVGEILGVFSEKVVADASAIFGGGLLFGGAQRMEQRVEQDEREEEQEQVEREDEEIEGREGKGRKSTRRNKWRTLVSVRGATPRCQGTPGREIARDPSWG